MDKCHNCRSFGGLNMDAIPPLGGYWCFAMKRYMVDTKAECPFFQEMIPEGATCTHPDMTECHPGCGHFYCPDCGLTWDDGAAK